MLSYRGKEFDKRKMCSKHINCTINSKYGKCFQCRIEDGDLVQCDCGEGYYDSKKFKQCYKCASPKYVES